MLCPVLPEWRGRFIVRTAFRSVVALTAYERNNFGSLHLSLPIGSAISHFRGGKNKRSGNVTNTSTLRSLFQLTIETDKSRGSDRRAVCWLVSSLWSTLRQHREPAELSRQRQFCCVVAGVQAVF